MEKLSDFASSLTKDELAVLFFSNPDAAGIRTALMSAVGAVRSNDTLVFTTKESYFWAVYAASVSDASMGGAESIDDIDFARIFSRSDFRNLYGDGDEDAKFTSRLDSCFNRLYLELQEKLGPDSISGMLPGDVLNQQARYQRDLMKRAAIAYNSLVGKGLIIDPIMEGLAFSVLGLLPYRFTMRSKAGEIIYQNYEAVFWRYTREAKGADRVDCSFEIKLFSFVDKIKKSLVRTLSEIYDPAVPQALEEDV